MESQHLNFRFKIENKPDGTFASVSENPELNFEGATKEEVEQKVLQKVGELAGPQVAEALMKIGSGALGKAGVHVEKKFSVVVNKSTHSAGATFSTNQSSPTLDLNSGPISREPEPAISRQVLWAIIAALALLSLWLLTHRA